MKTDELREKYLEFFVSKGCVRRPSDVLVPREDPTVLFTPAGMNQFKNQFLGIGPLEFTKATTCQKCLRTGDIDNVGVTAYHHTFFEMLGNFSFGDYFKKEAIHWGWEFLTSKKWLGLAPERLTVTVYLDDDEAAKIWEKEIRLSKDRIFRCDEMENFWPAGAPTHGPDGVCGPCSEIYYHPPSGGKQVEIWNLVFTQFNRSGNPPDNLKPLPKKNIDTGMGLERTAAVLQGFESNYEIDILRPLCEAAGEVVGKKYDFQGPTGRPLRRIADHVRAVTMCGHEGVVPDNAKQGYIVRQLLRRAMLEGFLLGQKEPFLHLLVPVVAQLMKRPYPDIAQSVGAVAKTVQEEESQFLGTIDRGMVGMEKAIAVAKKSGGVIAGETVFQLHTREGFLYDLTEQIALRNGLTIDKAEYARLMKAHEEVSSGAGGFDGSVMAEGPLDTVRKKHGSTKFLGYADATSTAKIVGLVIDKQLADTAAQSQTVGILLDQTPFYGESGGQVGDSGVLKTATGTVRITDTQRNGDLTVHIGLVEQGAIKVGDPVSATIDVDRRSGIRRAHSATHLLHHALRKTLGPNAMQRGSKVENDALRFDFAHGQPVSPDELRAIEDEINRRVAEAANVSTDVIPQQTAKERGAMMLFGEKYPDNVRVVQMGEFSIECCGGTHLANTGQVGLCRVLYEEPVAKGVRRIVALTGQRAMQAIRDTENLLKQTAQLVKAPQLEEIPQRVTALQDELRLLKAEISQFRRASLGQTIDTLLAEAEVVNGTKIVTHIVENADRDLLREYVDKLRVSGSVAILLGAVIDGKVALTAAVSKDLVKRAKAGDCVKTAAPLVGGGGGGRPDLAEAGGKDVDKLPSALAAGAAYYRQSLS